MITSNLGSLSAPGPLSCPPPPPLCVLSLCSDKPQLPQLPCVGRHLDLYLSIYRSIYLSIHLSIYLSIHLSIYLSIYTYTRARAHTHTHTHTHTMLKHQFELKSQVQQSYLHAAHAHQRGS